MTGQPGPAAEFTTQYGTSAKEVFHALVRDELAKGADAGEQARVYAELGKPDFALAYLLAGTLSEAEKRDLYARAFERRAENTEAKAREFDRKFHRPFPMLLSEAAHDRADARRIRAGQLIRSESERHSPVL